MRMSRWVIVVGGVLVAVATGCGSDDGGSAADSVAREESDQSDASEESDVTDSGVPSSDDSSSDDSGAATPDDAAVCRELQRVHDLSEELNELYAPLFDEIAQGGDPAELLAQFPAIADDMEAALPELLDAYDDAAAVASGDVAADIRLVADGTEAITPELVELFRNVETLDDLTSLDQVLADPEVQEKAIAAGQAALRLDEFTIPTCGFRLSNA